jgi:hypothetical protein
LPHPSSIRSFGTKADSGVQKAEAAASKKAAEDQKKAAEEEKEWKKGSKSNAKKYANPTSQTCFQVPS